MIEYEDGVPSSAPQMAHDVSEYLMFVGRARVPDQKIMLCLALAIAATIYPAWKAGKLQPVEAMRHV